MAMALFNSLMKHTLRSVKFGIALMALIAAYIAVGSGLPAVRQFFERDELSFFNWWPLSLLMLLLVANLVTVTIERIPFTPPRYGVWCVHAGIVTLVLGGFWHYSGKVEGSTVVYVGRPATEHYYDRYERALYTKLNGSTASVLPLPGMPRYHEYEAGKLKNDDLTGLTPLVRRLDPATQEPVGVPLSDAVGVPDFRLDVVGYYPYADIRSEVAEDPASERRGVKITVDDGHDHEPISNWLIAGDPRNGMFTVEGLNFEHRDAEAVGADGVTVNALVDALRNQHELTISVKGGPPETLHVEVGKMYEAPGGQYRFTVESFMPAWQTMEKQTVQLLTLLVDAPGGRFRRQVISGRATPTDFKFANPSDPQASQQMGQRQAMPLDGTLDIRYAFKGKLDVLPGSGMMRNIVVTSKTEPSITVLSFGVNDAPMMRVFPEGEGTLRLPTPRATGMEALILRPEDTQRPVSVVTLKRHERVSAKTWVEPTPIDRRTKDAMTSGMKQVLVVRVSGGGHEEFVNVPFSPAPYESAWEGGLVTLPGMGDVVQLQLGNTARRLPARIKLDKFEAVSYSGVTPMAGVAMRDFRSHVTLTDPRTMKSSAGTIAMNEPVYYRGGDWLFFQSGWDDQKQQFSWIGIGNRPGVGVMVAGCVMIFGGLLYAFYVKPIVIKARKERALREAKAKQRVRQEEPVPV